MLFPVSPPDEPKGGDKQVRHSKHIKNARIQTTTGGAAICEIGFGGHTAHRTLSLQISQKDSADQEDACYEGKFENMSLVKMHNMDVTSGKQQGLSPRHKTTPAKPISPFYGASKIAPYRLLQK